VRKTTVEETPPVLVMRTVKVTRSPAWAFSGAIEWKICKWASCVGCMVAATVGDTGTVAAALGVAVGAAVSVALGIAVLVADTVSLGTRLGSTVADVACVGFVVGRPVSVAGGASTVGVESTSVVGVAVGAARWAERPRPGWRTTG
jgi:hypothetical protein